MYFLPWSPWSWGPRLTKTVVGCKLPMPLLPACPMTLQQKTRLYTAADAEQIAAMSQDAIDKIIGEALVNRRFRAVLLRNPAKVVDSFDLSPEERQLLSTLRAGSLQELASRLYEGINKRGRDDISPAVDHSQAKEAQKNSYRTLD